MSGSLRREDGQSVLEFLFMLPVMVGLVMLMVRINTVIQVSIVNQQYSRAQATFLAFNNSVYPDLKLRYRQLVRKNYNQMMLGVSDNIVPADGSAYQPQATTQNIVRTRALAAQGNNDPQSEPDPNSGGTRALVRVRSTVSLCTQPNVLADGTPILEVKQSPDGSAVGVAYALPENPKFDYCRGRVNE